MAGLTKAGPEVHSESRVWDLKDGHLPALADLRILPL